jgi:hypothetical protein
MPYFHGTRKENLASILRHGLGGVDPGPNSEQCERGVYLAETPWLSIGILLDQMFSTGDDSTVPNQELDRWVVIVVDDSRINGLLLRRDPHLDDEWKSWIYDGVIDVTNAVILSVDDVLADHHATSNSFSS